MTTTKNKMVFDDLFNDVWEYILERAVLAGIIDPGRGIGHGTERST